MNNKTSFIGPIDYTATLACHLRKLTPLMQFVVNRYFHPDQSATSQLASDLAIALAARGMKVTAIASRQLYDNPDARLPARESYCGVTILRVNTTRFGRSNLLGRAFDYVSYYLGASWTLWRQALRGTVVVTMTDPPLLGVPVALICRLRGAHLVQWLQDVFPEVAVRMGVLRNGIAARLLAWLRDWSLRHSAEVVVIGDRMASFIAEHCAKPPVVIPNWALEELAVESNKRNLLREKWSLGEYFVVGYSGNMGRAHRLDGLVDAASMLRDLPGFRLLMIGDGAQRAGLEGRAQAMELRNVQFRPYQPRERLRDSLGVPDIHVVSLEESLEGLVVPSKFAGAIAMGRPVLWIGAADGEVGSLVREYGCGLVVRTGDTAALAGAMRELAADFGNGGARLAHMATQARVLWRGRLQRESAIRAWGELLEHVGQSRD